MNIMTHIYTLSCIYHFSCHLPNRKEAHLQLSYYVICL